jgi:hypothetical protein
MFMSIRDQNVGRKGGRIDWMSNKHGQLQHCLKLILMIDRKNEDTIATAENVRFMGCSRREQILKGGQIYGTMVKIIRG